MREEENAAIIAKTVGGSSTDGQFTVAIVRREDTNELAIPLADGPVGVIAILTEREILIQWLESALIELKGN